MTHSVNKQSRIFVILLALVVIVSLGCANLPKAFADPMVPDYDYTGFVNDSATNDKYYAVDGQIVKSKEIQDTGDWYWFKADGKMARDEEVYLNSSGGKWVYYDSFGRMVKGVRWINSSGGKWVYYSMDTGAMAHGEAYLNYDSEHTGWYYFDQNTGAMAHGVKWLNTDGGKWVYYDHATGIMAHGEAYINYDSEHTGWYYFDQNSGKMAHGDVYLPSNGGKWVRYNEKTGKMVYGLDFYHGAWYYFDKGTGKMAHGRTWVPEWNKWVTFNQTTGRYIEPAKQPARKPAPKPARKPAPKPAKPVPPRAGYQGYKHHGSFCSPRGATATDDRNGNFLHCKIARGGRLRWAK